jgi:hypothetical protein
LKKIVNIKEGRALDIKKGNAEAFPLEKTDRVRFLAGAGAPAATSGGTGTTAKLQAGVNLKAHVGHVHCQRLCLGVQVFFHHEFEAVRINHFVCVCRLIQSQLKLGACSAASREKNPDGGFFFVGKILFELLTSSFC